MSDFIKTQSSFANGEVAPEFYNHDNIHGLSRLENMDVLSGGGLRRRCGLTSVALLDGHARLIPFSASDNLEYLIVLTDCHMFIYRDNKLFQDLITPWGYDDLFNIQYAQRFGTMIFVHPDYVPQTLYWDSGRFYMSDFAFSRNDSDMTLNIPFVKFEDASDVQIQISTSSLGNNYAVFSTNRAFWTPDYVNTRLYLQNRQWVITEYINETQVTVFTNGSYTATDTAITDWREAAFSKHRGWPRSITFHQDRLVFGGSRDWPSGIWMSHVGNHQNFSVGTGLDDEGIFLSLLSQQRQQICTVVSSDNLQILTNVGEWAISSKPLTPSSVDIKQHTSVGSYSARYLPPQRIEGATVFVSANGCDIRELSLDELGEHYNANDLSMLSKHLIQNPLDIAYNESLHQLFIVKQDGTMAVLNQNAALGVSAWGTYRTSGQFLSVTVCNQKTYVVVLRDDQVFLEYFDSNALRDADEYDYSFCASSLPLRISNHNVTRIKLRKIVVRIMDTKSIYINTHQAVLPNDIYDTASNGFTGDVSLNCLGTSHDGTRPLWTLHGSAAYPATVSSVCIHGWYSV